ncbi:MAG: aminomethyl-transferring glycine dehydrogenase [Chromatocurvus sp.]
MSPKLPGQPSVSATLDRLADPPFSDRHIGPAPGDIEHMLASLGCDSVDALVEHALPAAIRQQSPLAVPPALSEQQALASLRAIAERNEVKRSLIGQGYYGTVMPAVVQRNVLENPAWYTAYTPYQPDNAKGRLESLLNFQQMVMDLTGMDLANASLLDEATAAAEAMAVCLRAAKGNRRQQFFADARCHPQTLAVLRTRAAGFGIELVVDDAAAVGQYAPFGALFSYPDTHGEITDIEALIQVARDGGAMVAVASDLLALVLLRSPGDMGADIVFGSAQRFGVPMGYGGPHAAFFAAREPLKRMLPGRIIGVSVDSRGGTALRMAMQTREQHIRRERATSNICTAQALLANLAAFYAVYHGPEGLQTIAERVHRLAAIFARGLAEKGVVTPPHFFDTVVFEADAGLGARAESAGYNLRCFADGRYGVSFDETCSAEDVDALLSLVTAEEQGLSIDALDRAIAEGGDDSLPPSLRRSDAILTHPVFSLYRSEAEITRYMRRLEARDYSLVHGMIPLGSCTMKLNATAEMLPISWPEFAHLHPYAPASQAQGYAQLLADLERDLADITGYDAVSMQPNSGAQGEYAGLLAIRRYHDARGDSQRKVCLIPASAHGTNPASAAMMGMKVVIVDCDENGNVDLEDLRSKADAAGDTLAACMITYPSTHGVYEEGVQALCEIIHQRGGQVYLDGANLNAMVGLARPGHLGADVSHLNLHKTFAIPHGGGGPGMGPIGVRAHLAPFLPGSPVEESDAGAVSAAPFGSAGILPITWMYNRMLGPDGLRQSTAVAILSANYIAAKLAPHYRVLYRGKNGLVAHECIVDLRPLKSETGVTEEDVSKRLMDYGFHAPTMSFPVPGTLMIEPTESESLAELDRFIEAMVGIRAEVDRVASGEWPRDNNPLVNAPHTQADLVADWDRPYSRELAVFPVPLQRQQKFWPSVNRVDNVHGDRHLICSCPDIESYREVPAEPVSA